MGLKKRNKLTNISIYGNIRIRVLCFNYWGQGLKLTVEKGENLGNIH